MKIKNKVTFCLLVSFLLAANVVFAQSKDREGSQDHPFISRFPGSIIDYYEVKKFDEYVLPLGKIEESKLSKSERLEGKVTRIQYRAPENRSTLEIYRNYELELKKAGFETLFTGAGEELGNWPGLIYQSLNPLRDNLKYYLQGDINQQRYLAAKLSRPEGDIYVSLYVSLGWYKWAMIQLDVIEIEPMETGLVTVNVDAMAKEIDKTGHVAVYGIYFDTGKAEVKTESEPVLGEIANLLRLKPELKLVIVGHTDNVGDLTYNIKLSQDRAEAVVTTLVSKHGIDKNRLQFHGVGFLVPVASNKTEEGRAKNRRVELVEQ